jgi:hypothetical protein
MTPDIGRKTGICEEGGLWDEALGSRTAGDGPQEDFLAVGSFPHGVVLPAASCRFWREVHASMDWTSSVIFVSGQKRHFDLRYIDTYSGHVDWPNPKTSYTNFTDKDK